MGNATSGAGGGGETTSGSGGKSPSRRNSSSGRKSSGSGSGHRGGDRDSSDRHKRRSSSMEPPTTAEEVAARAQQVVGESVHSLQKGLQKSIRKLEDEDHPAAHFLDSVCGPYMDNDPHHHTRSGHHGHHHHRHGNKGSSSANNSIGDSFYSSEDDEEATLSDVDDETTKSSDCRGGGRRGGRGRSRYRRRDDPSEAEETMESFIEESDYDDSEDRRRRGGSSSRHHRTSSSSKKKSSSSRNASSSRGRTPRDEKSPAAGAASFESEDDSYSRLQDRGGDNDTATEGSTSGVVTKTEEVSAITPGSTTTGTGGGINKPLASSFAKRCYFTKSGIGKTTQHYEGLTLTGNVVLMLAAAMKLKGCPTICDEDLRRVEQTYPNQFSRLPDELLLSSGWRRISKYCHFSHKPIPDGIPFFHSKQRLHPTGGYFFLLAAAVGMVRPIDVEPLTRDTLVLLETDFPAACDASPRVLIQDPDQWTLVDKFCFFSGGPINTDEDVYYQADFDGNPIYMLAFLSPSLTPAELYKLDPLTPAPPDEPPALKSVAVVQEVESVYDLTERDFDDLKLYHLGPCRALPQYILQPSAWTKCLPPPFLAAREQALFRAEQYEMQQQQHQLDAAMPGTHDGSPPGISASEFEQQQQSHYHQQQHADPTYHQLHEQQQPQHYNDNYQQEPLPQYHVEENEHNNSMAPMDETAAATMSSMRLNNGGPMDPPEDEPPSLSKRDVVSGSGSQEPLNTFSSVEPNNEAYYNDEGGEYDEQGEYYSVSSPERVASGASEEYLHQGGHFPEHEGQSADYDDREKEYHEHEEQYHEHDEMYQHQQISSDYQESADEYHHEHGGVGMEEYHRHHGGGGVGMDEFHESGTSDTADQEYQELAVTSSEYNQENRPDPGEMEQGDPEDAYHEMGGGGSDYHDVGEYYGQDNHVNYYGASGVAAIQEEPGVGRDDDYPAGENAEREDAPASIPQRRIDTAMDASPQMRKSDLPPTSPSSASEYSHTSSAMRGAQELLKRNRQRRLAQRKNNINTADEGKEENSEEPTDVLSPKDAISPRSEISGATWESGSEVTSTVSGASSVWTDNSNNPDRSSRRALILQMAKARMKSNKGTGAPTGTTDENDVAGAAKSPSSAGFSPRSDDFDVEEEKKLENLSESATDIDIAGDLD